MSALAPLVVILGPTASGKSSLAIWLAERLNGEVLVCDSTQVYKLFNIGTAKVPAAEQHGIPHHLVDLLEPEQIFTAGEYRRRALQVLAEVTRRRKLPILTAGTGLYLRALLEGLSDAPERSEGLRSRLREKAQQRGPEHLHRVLARLDPGTASRIAPRDKSDSGNRSENARRKGGGRNPSRGTQQAGRLRGAENRVIACARCFVREDRSTH